MNKTIFPGIGLVIGIALIGRYIEKILPIHIVSASVMALFIGMSLNRFIKKGDVFEKGIAFSSKKLLKLAIILLGASLNISIILEVGKISGIVLAFTLSTCFGGGYLLGKILGINWKLSSLLSASTAICGGTAIVSVAPILEAKDVDIAYSLTATFLFDMIMILIFPLLGRLLDLSDVGFGLWSGTSIGDTSSVVAIAYGFSEKAGDFATMVKLTRTLFIIPTVIAFTIISIKNKNLNSNRHGESDLEGARLKSVIPWFILGFVALAMINSLGFIPLSVSKTLKDISKFLMISALAAIGLSTNLGDLRKAGIEPLLHKLILSYIVILVSLMVIQFFGLN